MKKCPDRWPYVLVTAMLLALTAAPVLAEDETTEPRAAVVRVSAPHKTGISHGSGTLVAVTEKHGLILTNWHVVRDATGQIFVEFPNGYRSAATVLKTDKTWDLAALMIWRPETDVEPVELATDPPERGDELTIAGYGSGKYREATGEAVQYVSPGSDHPFEIVELSAAARSGDSGGPILNRRGQIAGVLFGSADGRTDGSHCVRIRWFLRQALTKVPKLAKALALVDQAEAI